MFKIYVLCIFIIIPEVINTKTNTTETLLQHLPNITTNNTLEIPSEGGSVLEKKSLLALLKGNDTNSISLEKEIVTKEKSVVPRKGVKYNPHEDNITAVKSYRNERIDTTITKINDTHLNRTEKISQTTTNKIVSQTFPDDSEETVKNLTTSPKPPKKPLVVSYEALSELAKTIPNPAVPINPEPSSKISTVTDQLPAPIKAHSTTSSKHPGMIMPVVITMFVVPMFAVLGYLALRRGQEAWKNRHYKRMDFLLDGMYND